MATRTVQNTIDFAQPFLKWLSLTLGTNSEPAMTAANTIQQTIVSPPFEWPWNRAKTTIAVSQGIQDYTQAITTFGYLETASIQPSATITNTVLTSNAATYTAANSFAVGQNVTITGTTNGGGVFNVTSRPIVTASATQFAVAITHADVASASDTGTAISNQIFELTLKSEALSETGDQSRPTFISTQISDGAGSITFRLMPVPDQTYQLNLTYQNTLALLTATSSKWGIPDYLAYIYNYGFLFLMLDYFDDPRAGRYRQLFVASLLARAEGLDETDRNIFLGNWLPLLAQEQASQLRTSQGTQARGL